MRIKEVHKWSDSGPSQWSFKDEDDILYWVNYNHGYLFISKGTKDSNLCTAILGEVIYKEQLDSDLTLGISFDRVERIIEKL